MTESIKRLNYTDKAYLEDLYLGFDNRDEIIDFIKHKFPKQLEKVKKLPLNTLKLAINNLIKRYE